MQIITSIHLNGKAYQLEEAGYEALSDYLARAEAALKENPDKAEIITDLEQAIGEKCQRYLNVNKDVVRAEEISKIISEMGPVEGSAEESTKTESKQEPSQEPKTAQKKLYLIYEGSWISGVCTGLAAYFDVDVTVVRVIFAAATIFTGGLGLLAYIALALIIPYASTSEQRAEAHGETFNAQEIVRRAKMSYEQFANKEEWQKVKQEMHKAKHQMHREWHNHHRHHGMRGPVASTPGASMLLGLVSVGIGIVWVMALISLLATGAIFGWMVPGMPLWVAVILLFFVFHMVTGPLRAAKWMRYGHHGHHYRYDAWEAITDAIGIAFIVIAFIFSYMHFPQVKDFVDHLPQNLMGWIETLRNK